VAYTVVTGNLSFIPESEKKTGTSAPKEKNRKLQMQQQKR